MGEIKNCKCLCHTDIRKVSVTVYDDIVRCDECDAEHLIVVPDHIPDTQCNLYVRLKQKQVLRIPNNDETKL